MPEKALTLKPIARISPTELPSDLHMGLTSRQQVGLAFAKRDLRVINAKIQSFQIGSTSSGSVKMGGLATTLGSHWAVFGTVGSINQQTANVFRTDIQIKLEDQATGERTFLDFSLPFAITLSIDPGEILRVFYAKGGLENPTQPHDFRLNNWTQFVAMNLETGQVIPIGALPSLEPPDFLAPLLTGLGFGALGLVLVLAEQLAYGIGGLVLCGILATVAITNKLTGDDHFKLAAEEAHRVAV